MDVVPVVFGSGKRYFGSVHAPHLLEDPDGDRATGCFGSAIRGPLKNPRVPEHD